MKALNEMEWGEFVIGELFDVKGTITTHPSVLINGGNTPRITCAATNNGFENTYGNKATEKGQVLTIDSATVGFVSYQATDFIATDHVEKISMKNGSSINRYLGLFLVNAISFSSSGKYGYGYKFSQSRIVRQKILLPITEDGKPDYAYMEAYMREKERILLERYREYLVQLTDNQNNKWGGGGVKPLNEMEWREFKIRELFTLEQGKSKGLNHLSISDKGINYLGATNLNNAVLCQVEKIDDYVQRGNCIAFIRNGEGSMGYSVYKVENFIATSDISAGYNKNLNRYVGSFITTVADRVRGKYNFGYKRSATRLAKESLMLPINKDGEPDYAYMEAYMRLQEQKQLKRYLKYLEGKQ